MSEPTTAAPPGRAERYVYRDYLGWVGEAGARRVLLLLAAALVAGEAAVRIAPPSNPRTAVSSLHGARAILQDALDDPREKVLGVGDSTLVGGGVYAHDRTVMGYLAAAVPDRAVYNLAVPGGDPTTSLVTLDAVRRAGLGRVDRVIIEVIPGKFLTEDPAAPVWWASGAVTADTLQKYVPFVRPWDLGLPVRPAGFQARTEAALQWHLGRASLLYRHRDYFRTEYLGNYPSFWLIGATAPRSLLARLFPAKGQGTNRLAARADDFDYDPATAPASNGRPVHFTRLGQGEYLERAVDAARELSGKPPIILAFPMHTEFARVGPAERAQYRAAVAEFEAYLAAVAGRTGSDLIVVPSDEFQDPGLWTATPAHFNARGSERIWEYVRPRLCDLLPCRPADAPTPGDRR